MKGSVGVTRVIGARVKIRVKADGTASGFSMRRRNVLPRHGTLGHGDQRI